MTGSALHLPEVTFPTFRAFTPELDGAGRAELFARLPPRARQEAWRDLADRMARWREAER